MTETTERTVRVVENVSAEQFRADIFPGNEPVLLKGLVAHWPAVIEGRTSPEAMMRYIRRFDQGKPVETIMGPSAIEGRFFYNEKMDGLNFSKKTSSIGRSMDRILALRGHENPPSIYIQSTPVSEYLPGFAAENTLAIAADTALPRIWIGNRLTVQTHFDVKENIACVVSGRRRFTLFPPAQTPNLYPGPFELTLSGPPVSMVRLDTPDFNSYPKFRAAMEHAVVADLVAGDALYIPYFWWHHVQSQDDFNVLVNYWWNDADPGLGSPFDALLHALLNIRDLPERQRDAWKTMFDTYVFACHGDPLAHLPVETHGTLGRHDERARQQARMLLLGMLSRQAGIGPPGKF
jgi:hypothetical protein